jgi:hypothetical protein
VRPELGEERSLALGGWLSHTRRFSGRLFGDGASGHERLLLLRRADRRRARTSRQVVQLAWLCDSSRMC